MDRERSRSRDRKERRNPKRSSTALPDANRKSFQLLQCSDQTCNGPAFEVTVSTEGQIVLECIICGTPRELLLHARHPWQNRATWFPMMVGWKTACMSISQVYPFSYLGPCSTTQVTKTIGMPSSLGCQEASNLKKNRGDCILLSALFIGLVMIVKLKTMCRSMSQFCLLSCLSSSFTSQLFKTIGTPSFLGCQVANNSNRHRGECILLSVLFIGHGGIK